MTRAAVKRAVTKAEKRTATERRRKATKRWKGDAEKALIARFISPTRNLLLWVESPEEEALGTRTRTKRNTGFAAEFKENRYEIPNTGLTTVEEKILLRIFEVDIEDIKKRLSEKLGHTATDAEAIKEARPVMNERFILWMTEHGEFRRGFHPLPQAGDWWEAHDFFRSDTKEVLSPTKKFQLRQDERDKITGAAAQEAITEMGASGPQAVTTIGTNT